MLVVHLLAEEFVCQFLLFWCGQILVEQRFIVLFWVAVHVGHLPGEVCAAAVLVELIG